jgi:hypothetical protein
VVGPSWAERRRELVDQHSRIAQDIRTLAPEALPSSRPRGASERPRRNSSASEGVAQHGREAARLPRVDGKCPVFVLRQEANVYWHIADDGHLVTTVAVGLRHEQRVIDGSGGADFFPWLEAMD